MGKSDYVLPDFVTAGEVKEIRKQLGLSQAGFAEFVKVSKSTVERWEAGSDKITGPVVPLLVLLREHPEYEGGLRVPKKEYSLRLWYMHANFVCTIIDVEERLRKVKIYNYTDNLLYRAFGRVEHPGFSQYEEFLESRVFPRSRDKIKLELERLGVPFYDPILIIEKTQGRMAEDNFWIRIER